MAGRPTKYKEEYASQATKLCQLGATDSEIADFFNVDERTINNWKTAHPEFFQSLKAGKELADDRVERALYQRAIGYTHDAVKIVADAKTGESLAVPFREHYPPDTTAAIFWLKNRKPADWRDKTEQQMSGRMEVVWGGEG